MLQRLAQWKKQVGGKKEFTGKKTGMLGLAVKTP